jgi:hypothetical protein
MALDQSALLDLLAQLKLTDVADRIRSATEILYQELIDAEATSFIRYKQIPVRVRATILRDENLRDPESGRRQCVNLGRRSRRSLCAYR